MTHETQRTLGYQLSVLTLLAGILLGTFGLTIASLSGLTADGTAPVELANGGDLEWGSMSG